jgi:hypothetical protein
VLKEDESIEKHSINKVVKPMNKWNDSTAKWSKEKGREINAT